MKKIRWGIVGPGGIANKVANAIKKLERNFKFFYFSNCSNISLYSSGKSTENSRYLFVTG